MAFNASCVDRDVRRHAGINAQLVQQLMQADAVQNMTNADAQRARLIMRAHHNHRMVKAHVPNARHRQQHLA